MRIGVDIDDVLADTLPAFVRFNNEHHGGSWTTEHFHTAHWEEVLGLSSEQMGDRLESFFDSSHFRAVGPAQHAQGVLNKLRTTHELHIVSARWDRIVDYTTAWLDEHFPAFFSGIHFAANHYTTRASTRGMRRTKAELLAHHGVEVIIEDSLEYAERCRAAGFGVILFDRPWNRRAESADYHRVADWLAVPPVIEQMSTRKERRR